MKNEIIKRATSPTPKFFKRLRNISLTLAAIATGILSAPVAMPAALITVAGYLMVGSTVAAAVSQLPVETVDETEPENEKI